MKAFTQAPDAKSTEFEEQVFWVSPVIETSSKDLKWLERCLLIGQGRYIHNEEGYGVEYEIYKLVH